MFMIIVRVCVSIISIMMLLPISIGLLAIYENLGVTGVLAFIVLSWVGLGSTAIIMNNHLLTQARPFTFLYSLALGPIALKKVCFNVVDRALPD